MNSKTFWVGTNKYVATPTLATDAASAASNVRGHDIGDSHIADVMSSTMDIERLAQHYTADDHVLVVCDADNAEVTSAHASIMHAYDEPIESLHAAARTMTRMPHDADVETVSTTSMSGPLMKSIFRVRHDTTLSQFNVVMRHEEDFRVNITLVQCAQAFVDAHLGSNSDGSATLSSMGHAVERLYGSGAEQALSIALSDVIDSTRRAEEVVAEAVGRDIDLEPSFAERIVQELATKPEAAVLLVDLDLPVTIASTIIAFDTGETERADDMLTGLGVMYGKSFADDLRRLLDGARSRLTACEMSDAIEALADSHAAGIDTRRTRRTE